MEGASLSVCSGLLLVEVDSLPRAARGAIYRFGMHDEPLQSFFVLRVPFSLDWNGQGGKVGVATPYFPPSCSSGVFFIISITSGPTMLIWILTF